jgi:hypothetical protein
MFALCVVGVSLQKSKWFTIDDMIWFIAYMFFVIAPLQGINHGHITDGPVDLIEFTNEQFIKAMLEILIFFVVFLVVRLIYDDKASRKMIVDVNNVPSLLLLLLSVVAFIGVVVGAGGFGNLLATRYDKDASMMSVIQFPAEAAQLVITFVIVLQYKNSVGINRLFLFFITLVALIFLTICENPINTSRYFLLAAWFPVAYIWFNGKLPFRVIYVLLFLSMLFVMPILNLTSREGATFLDAIDNTDFSSGIFRIPFIDVFDMSVFQMLHSTDDKYYWGQKTLGLIFFFVPRDIWTAKATLSGLDLGTFLAEYRIAGTANLSFFVAGDFYADLGFVGVAIGAIVLNVYLCRGLLRNKILFNGIDLRGGILTAAMPILIRGPLGANVGLTFLEILILSLLTVLVRRQKNALVRE